MAMAVCLWSCGGTDEPQTDTQSAQNGEVTEEQSETNTPPTKQKVSLGITKGKIPLYQVVYPAGLGEDSRTAVTDFILDVYEKTGVQLPITSDSASASDNKKEIIICGTTRSASKDMSSISYAEYGMEALEDGTILVWGYGNTYLDKALGYLLNGMVKMQDGGYYYKGLVSIESSGSDILAELPKATFGKVDGVYESADDVYQVTVGEAQLNDFKAYKSLLANGGYTLHAENTIDSKNVFATYKNDKYAIHLGYHGNTSQMEIIIEKLGYLPSATAPTYTKKVSASITQMKLGSGGGMSYVIQLEDGSLVVIDGGLSDYTARKELLTVLQSKNARTDFEKPRVTWMFTHAHPDHIQLAADFLNENSKNIELVLVCANFIDQNSKYASTIGDGYSHATLMNIIRSKYPRAEIMNFHTGQTLKLAGCEIDFYLTHEDIYPVAVGTLNSTSSVWRMDFGGKTFMVLGDTTETGAEILNAYYGSTLKSTVMQAAHHGVTASSGTTNIKALYANILPDVVMWANADKAAVEKFAGNKDILARSGLVSIYSNEIKSYLIENN